MNAIVVVFIPADDGQLPAQQAAGDNLAILRQGLGLGMAKTDSRQTSDRNQTSPPFWTWFIENPPGCGA